VAAGGLAPTYDAHGNITQLANQQLFYDVTEAHLQ
jgi:hypothetical protein